MTFERDEFVNDCVAAVAADDGEHAIFERLAGAVAEPGEIIDALGKPEQGGVQALHVSDQLTILNVIWAPRMTLMPHDHHMWAIIGVYAGREDNIFWRRRSDDRELIEAAGAKSLGVGDTQPLGINVIHSVTNPTSTYTAAIHVYGGNFFEKERSEWDPLSLREEPYDIKRAMALFESANAASKS